MFGKSPTGGFTGINKKLRLLNLGNNELTAGGVRLLSEALPAFTALEELLRT